jgi:hypothetical protein
VINNSGMTPAETSAVIIADVKQRLEEQETRKAAQREKPRW